MKWIPKSRVLGNADDELSEQKTVCAFFSLLFGAYFSFSKLDDLQSIFLFLLLNHFADSESGIIQFLSTSQSTSQAAPYPGSAQRSFLPERV